MKRYGTFLLKAILGLLFFFLYLQAAISLFRIYPIREYRRTFGEGCQICGKQPTNTVTLYYTNHIRHEHRDYRICNEHTKADLELKYDNVCISGVFRLLEMVLFLILIPLASVCLILTPPFVLICLSDETDSSSDISDILFFLLAPLSISISSSLILNHNMYLSLLMLLIAHLVAVVVIFFILLSLSAVALQALNWLLVNAFGVTALSRRLDPFGSAESGEEREPVRRAEESGNDV